MLLAQCTQLGCRLEGMSIHIRSYEPTADRAAAFQLWEVAFGQTWPLHREGFYAHIDPQAEHHLVAQAGEKLLGLIALSLDAHVRGSIFAILVHPDHQSQGIEGMLLEAATQHLQQRGATTLRFGCGQSYFWPGVPLDQPHTRRLLEQHGWQAHGQNCDLVGDVQAFTVPVELTERIANSHANLRLATVEDVPAILEFQERHFPQWRRTAARRVERGDVSTILLAELQGEIVGTTFLTLPGTPGFLWRRALGEDCAAFGALGVREAVRGRYIGYALAVRATELLTERGAKKIFVGWVFSTQWYGRLGFHIWQSYHAMSTELT